MEQKRRVFSWIILLIFPSLAFCLSGQTPQNWDLSVAFGPNLYQVSNSSTQSLPHETDVNQVINIPSGLWYRMGIGYHLFSNALNNRKFFNDLLVQLNFYYASLKLEGNVYQNGSPLANNFTFTAPVNSSRLMLDLKPTLFTMRSLSTYLILGAGVVWNTISFSETPVNAEFAPYALNLSAKTNQMATYDFGIGMRTKISDHASISFEYLNMPSVNLTPGSENVVAPPTFSLQTQTILAGVDWRF